MSNAKRRGWASRSNFAPSSSSSRQTPSAQCTWLLSALYPADPDIAFGLCDLGVGFPELGDVSLSELRALRGPCGCPVERDLSFIARKTVAEYAREAYAAGRITA